MENASKALIIAGAILLSILIISLGLMVFNQAKDTAGSSNLDEQTIQAFNSKFTAYQGEKVSGSKVNSLIQTVISSNQAEINAGTEKHVDITFPSVSGSDLKISVEDTSDTDKTKVIKYSDTTAAKKVNPGRTYTVNIKYEKGLVSEIEVN